MPFAYRVGTTEIVCIDDARRGRQCDCVCIGCGAPVIARHGDMNEHCFAHDFRGVPDDRECPYSEQTVLRMLIIDILPSLRSMALPSGEQANIEAWTMDLQTESRHADALANLSDGRTLLLEVPPPGRLLDRLRTQIESDLKMLIDVRTVSDSFIRNQQVLRSSLQQILESAPDVRSWYGAAQQSQPTQEDLNPPTFEHLPTPPIESAPATHASWRMSLADEIRQDAIGQERCMICGARERGIKHICRGCKGVLLTGRVSNIGTEKELEDWFKRGNPGISDIRRKIAGLKSSPPTPKAIKCPCGSELERQYDGRHVCPVCTARAFPKWNAGMEPLQGFTSLYDWQRDFMTWHRIRNVPFQNGLMDLCIINVTPLMGISALEYVPCSITTSTGGRYYVHPILQYGIHAIDVHHDFRPLLLIGRGDPKWLMPTDPSIR
jgi:hypothetical protein